MNDGVWKSSSPRPGQSAAQGPRLAVGTGGDGWQVLARLSPNPEVCTAFTGLDMRTLAVLYAKEHHGGDGRERDRDQRDRTQLRPSRLSPTGPATLTATRHSGIPARGPRASANSTAAGTGPPAPPARVFVRPWTAV